MRFSKTLWCNCDKDTGEIRLSPENSLPLIFETEDEADKVREDHPSLKIEECVLVRKSDIVSEKLVSGSGYAILEFILPRLKALEDWSAPTIKALIHSVADELGVAFKDVAQPLRVAVSGSTISPGIGTTLELLKAESTLRRIKRCLDIC